ncbi:sushi, von Willebrand factor type A, EGF and pentraxin domain-containing protein 1-like [Magallana gigas]|uniref:sushi, von Willebrand factor type A, EGF and pentraxin domain-containing protein 1-like n=1 Tax=Magallana gigas TaxID=29159 RepID=UPI003341717B
MRFNNRAMYSCREGYRSMSGSNIINCTASNWQTTTFSCYALSCGPAPNITNADVLVNDDGAMYGCDNGYIPSNTNNKIVCDDGIWSLTDFNCLRVCPLPKDIPNAEVTVENNTARYFCNPGYYQLENTDDFISFDGNEWQPTNFECIQICEDPLPIPNAEVMRFNNRAMYSCREGYRSMSGSNIINCTASNWQTTTFSCYALSCGPAPNITNADVLVNDDGAMYGCDNGYIPSNTNNKIVCDDGIWSLTDFNCLRVCPLPKDIPNAEVTVENNTARYFCNPGYYQLENTDDFISCDGNEWQPTNFECIQICEDPLPIPNAEVMRFNNRAMYSCREGYRSMSGSNIINCTASNWQTTTFSCYALSCGPAPNITNADVLVNDDGAMYGCDNGYIPSNTNNKIVCDDGVWSFTDFKCLRVCPLPQDIPNAEVTVENNTARYFCNPGYYQLENTDDFISCDGNKWQPTNFECIQICEDPLPIPNAEVMRFNNRAMYSCREGYRSMSGSNIINCTASNWQTTTFSCYALSCGPAPNITNADVLVNDDGAMYGCDYGYIPSNTNNRIVCDDGVWSLTDFKCLRVCPLPKGIPNAEVTVENNTARYFCNPGYYQLENTDDFISCDGNEWQPTNFECMLHSPQLVNC